MKKPREIMDVFGEKFVYTFDEFDTDDDTSATRDLGYRGDNIYLLGVFAKVNTAFVTGTNPQMKLGYPGHDDFLIPLQSIAKSGRLKSGKMHQMFCEGMANPTGSAQAIRFTIQNDSGNLEDYTAGELEIVLVYVCSKY